MDLSGLRGIAFDKDGTLICFQRTWGLWARGVLLKLADNDEALAARYASALGFDMNTLAFSPSSVLIAGTPDDAAAVLCRVHPSLNRAHLARWLGDDSALAEPAELVPLRPLIQSIRDLGIAVGVVTNDSEASARAHLDGVGISDLLAFVAGYDSGYGAKPGPGPVQSFCAATGLAPHEVAMVGDSTHDLLAGRAAGTVTIAVLSGLADRDTLAPLADVVIPDVSHLNGLLRRSSMLLKGGCRF